MGWNVSDEEVVKQITEKQICSFLIDVPDKNGEMPLAKAMQKGYFKKMAKMIELGADVNTKLRVMGTNISPLGYAVETQNPKMARLLVLAGANVNEKKESGWSLLHTAATRGNLDVLRTLLDGGADVNACVIDTPLTEDANAFSFSGNRPIDVAYKKDVKKMLAEYDSITAEITKYKSKVEEKNLWNYKNENER